MPKTSEAELEKKAEYYRANKEKILARKHERKDEIYARKRERNQTSSDEFEKEAMRKLSREQYKGIEPTNCTVCNISKDDLGYPLERHHDSYVSTEVMFVCKPCHAELDKIRRRDDEKPMDS